MAINYGATTAGDTNLGGQRIDEVLENIQFSLDMVNDKSDAYAYKNEALALMESHVQEISGENNTVLAYEEFQVFFQDTGMAISPIEFKKAHKKWTLQKMGFEIKNISFTPDYIRKMKQDGKDPFKDVEGNNLAILKKYQNVFKPNYLYEALLEVPVAGGDYYANKGALRDVVVGESMIENVVDGASAGEKGSLTRNHFRAIADASGITSADLRFVLEYFDEYIDVDVNDLRMMGTLTTQNYLKEIFNDSQTLDEVILNGITGKDIEGIPFNANKMMPNGMLCFYIDTPDKPLFAKLKNINEEYNGLYLRSERDGEKFPETMEELISSKYFVGDVGYHLIGRHLVMFMDITPNASNANADREMQTAGFALLNGKKDSLHRQWNNVVR